MLTIKGQVLPGDQRGERELGFPTANISILESMLAYESELDGVWAGIAELDAENYWLTTVSIGRRPAFYNADANSCWKHTCWTSQAISTAKF